MGSKVRFSHDGALLSKGDVGMQYPITLFRVWAPSYYRSTSMLLLTHQTDERWPKDLDSRDGAPPWKQRIRTEETAYLLHGLDVALLQKNRGRTSKPLARY